MKLRTKILIWLFVKFCVFLLISGLLSLTWLKSVCLRFERNWIVEQKEEIYKYLEVEKKRVELLTRDWAFWDDAYTFVLTKKPEFVKANFNKETFLNNNLSLLAYLDLEGNPLVSGYFDKTKEKILPIDKIWLKEHLDFYRKLYPSINLNSTKSGLTFYNNIPHLISFYPVSDSYGKKDPVGILLMARSIDEEFVVFLREIFNLHDITFSYSKEPLDFGFFKIELIDDKYTVSLLLKDFFDKNMVLKYTILRKFYFEKYLFWFIIFQALFLFLIYAMFYFYIKNVFKSIENVKEDIKRIKENKKEKISELKYDEFSEIIYEFNSLYSALKEKIREVDHSKKVYQIIAEKVNLPIALFDLNKNLVYANRHWYNFFSENDIENIKNLIEKCKETEIVREDYVAGDFYIKIEITPIKEYSFYYLIIGYHIDILADEFKKIFERVTRDFLTQLYNRYYLEDAFKRVQGEVLRGSSYSILWIDVDDLKVINDTYGHVAGDEFLKYVADTIKKNCRIEDIPVRWGGDEFLVILKTDLEGAIKVAQRILKEISEGSIIFKEREIKGTVSMGIAKVTEKPLEEILEKLDKMLYEAKFEGKGRIRILEEV